MAARTRTQTDTSRFRGFTLVETLVACGILLIGMSLVTIWTVNELEAIRHDRNELTAQEILCSQMERLVLAGWHGPALRPSEEQLVALPEAVLGQLPGANMHRSVQQRSPWIRELRLRLDWTGAGRHLRSRELVRLVTRREGPRPKDMDPWHVSGDATVLP